MFPGFFRTVGFGALINAGDRRNRCVSSRLGEAVPAETLILPDARVLQVCTPPLHSMDRVRRWLADTVRLFQASTLTAEGGGR
jgi:hypothetical protein